MQAVAHFAHNPVCEEPGFWAADIRKVRRRDVCGKKYFPAALQERGKAGEEIPKVFAVQDPPALFAPFKGGSEAGGMVKEVFPCKARPGRICLIVTEYRIRGAGVFSDQG
jgi:hypothetical protein